MYTANELYIICVTYVHTMLKPKTRLASSAEFFAQCLDFQQLPSRTISIVSYQCQSQLLVKEFIPGITACLSISAAKDYCKHYHVPLLKYKGPLSFKHGMGYVVDIGLVNLCLNVTDAVIMPLMSLYVKICVALKLILTAVLLIIRCTTRLFRYQVS